MKKIFIISFLLCLNFLVAVNSLNGQTRNDPNIPSWLHDYPPDDVLWGIGVAKLENDPNAMDLAELRARIAIVNQIGAFISNDIWKHDYFLLQCVSIDVSFALKHDTRIIKRWNAPDRNWWYCIEMKKTDIRKYIDIYENVLQEYLKEYEELKNN